MVLHREAGVGVHQGQGAQVGGNEAVFGVAVHEHAHDVAHAGAGLHVLFGQQQVAVVGGEVEADAGFAGYFEVVVIAEEEAGHLIYEIK